MWVYIHKHIEKDKVWGVIHQNNNSNFKWWDYRWFLCFSLCFLFDIFDFMYCTWNWNIITVIYKAFSVKKIETNINEHAEARPLSQMLFQKCALWKLCILKKKCLYGQAKNILKTSLCVYEPHHNVLPYVFVHIRMLTLFFQKLSTDVVYINCGAWREAKYEEENSCICQRNGKPTEASRTLQPWCQSGI